MHQRRKPHRRRISAPAVRRSFFSRRLHFEPLEDRRLLAAGAVETADQAVELLGASPALFVENQGQWADESIRYAFFGEGANVLHTDTGPVLQLFQSAVGGVSDGDPSGGDFADDQELFEFQSPTETPPADNPDLIETATVAVHFNGADAINPVGLDRTETIHNYFIGDQSTWRSEVPTFETVAYPDLYAGIDLFTWGRRSSLKYEFHVAPGVDYRQIEVHYDGADGLWIDDAGALHINTPLGELVDDAPYIYQQINGQQVEVPGEFQLVDDDTYTFNLDGEYDTTFDLVIDPVLDWSTYAGGSGRDAGKGIAVDFEGNVFVTGDTDSLGWVADGYNTTYGGSSDAFVMKISPTGEHLWSTYLGGSNGEKGFDIAVDSVGNALVTGQTSSFDWVSGGFDTSPDGAASAFVAKLSPSGAHIWSTYVGGSSAGRGITVDFADNVLVTGSAGQTTQGSSSPEHSVQAAGSTPRPENWVSGGFDTSHGGSTDGFVAKISPSGEHLWSTFLGGSSVDRGVDIAVDSVGDVFVTGETSSSGWVAGGFDTELRSVGKAFVVKITSTGDHIWSTYLGGTAQEIGNGIAVDSDGNALVTGWTRSAGWTSNGFNTIYSGDGDAFLVKIGPTGDHIWSTYLGGSQGDSGSGVVANADGSLLVAGWSASSNWVSGGFDITLDGPSDAFVAKLSSAGALEWSTYAAGGISAIAIDEAGTAFVTGSADGLDEITGGFDTSYNGGVSDAYVAKIRDIHPPRVVETPLREGDTLSNASPTFTFRFSEPLDTTVLDATDITLVGASQGSQGPPSFEYDAATGTLALRYDNLPDDEYTLTLISSDSGFRDSSGRHLDGERHSTTTVPSGDGPAGGDFVVAFSLQSGPPRVIDSSLRDGDMQPVGGLTYTARFSESMNPNSMVAANVLLVGDTFGDQVPTSVAYDPGTGTLTASFPDLPVDQYTLTLRSDEGGLENLVGDPLDGERKAETTVPSGDGTVGGDFVVHFTVDATPPRVIESSIRQGDVLRVDTFEYVARFDEPLLASALDVSDVRVCCQHNATFVPQQFNYDAASSTLRLGFEGLPDDLFRLTLTSGSEQFRDTVGNDLDGERHPQDTVPSGDGTVGGDFVVEFFVDTQIPHVIRSSIKEGETLKGTGQLVYEATFNEGIDVAGVTAENVALVGTTVGAIAPTAVSYSPRRARVTATFENVPADEYTLTLRSGEGGLKDRTGNALDGERHATTTVPSGDGAAGGDFEVHFTVDRTPPHVVSSSILQDDLLEADAVRVLVQFSEPIQATNLDPSDFHLSSALYRRPPTSFSYDDATNTLTLEYEELSDGFYLLHLRSGAGRFEDLVGNALDGERHPTETVPSGNGLAGGEFLVDFLIDTGPMRIVASSIHEGDVSDPSLNFLASFSEPVDPEAVDAANIVIVGETVGVVTPTRVYYNSGSATFGADFTLAQDRYTLTLRSGEDGLIDTTGSQLDGEAHVATTVPSGDGVAGGDFVVHFTVDGVLPRIIASSILQNDVLDTGTLVYTVQFSEPMQASLLDARDARLSSNGRLVTTATQLEYDEATSTLTLGFGDVPDGSYTLRLEGNAGRFRDIAGNALDGERHPTTTVPSGDGAIGGDFVVDFSIEAGPPRVIESSIRENDVLPGGELTFFARFDEPLRADGVNVANVRLVGSTVGELAATSVGYGVNTSTITATFPSLPVDQYVLTLRSGEGGLVDLSGKPLDGERDATNDVPSGDGTAGGDFEVHFRVLKEISGTITSDTILEGSWYVSGDVVVPAGVTLTIWPGAELSFGAGVEMIVNGRITAVGEPDERIVMTSANGSKWDGIHIRDSLEDNVFAYVDIEDAQSSDGSIGAFESVLTIDNMSFAGSLRRYIRVFGASAVIRESVFSDRFGPGEVPGPDERNVAEMIHGIGIMAGGQMIIEDNVFGTNKGENDIIDFSGPVRPAPILQVLNNIFMGATDEMLDLGGDAYIEGNLFMHARSDEFNGGSGHTNVISTGDGPPGATIVAVRNVFYDIEHVIDLEDDHLAILEHNTIVGIPSDGLDPGDGTLQEYSAVNLVIVVRTNPGRGAHLEGNIFVDVPERIFGEPDTTRNGTPGPLSDLVVNNTLLPADRCGDEIGQRDGTIMDLGTNVLCGDAMLADVAAGDFSLLAGSPAIGAGVHGLDLGALVPAGATVSDVPAVVEENFANFTVDGPGIFEYQFRLDDAAWSDAASVDEPIELSDLADGAHRLEVVGMNYAGAWQDEADAVLRTWTVSSTVLPADLTGNGFVDFEDLTVLLAAWNQDVSAVEGNLVDADTTPVNFEDLTVLLAAWTGPGAAGAPVGRGLAAAVGGDSVGDVGGAGPLVAVGDASQQWVAVGDASYRRRYEAPRRAAAYGSATGVGSYGARRNVRRIRPAGGIYRLQAVAVDRVMGEEVMGRAMVGRREGRRRR